MSRTTSPTLALLITAIAIAGIATAPARAQAPEPFHGFNETAIGSNQLSIGTVLDLAQQGGADSLVFAADWRMVEAQPGAFNWSFTDAVYAASRARGIRPVFTLLYAPRWATGVDCGTDLRECRYPPDAAHDAAWAAFARRVAERYPELAAIQVWNEPNIPLFWKGGINPERYTELLSVAHDAVKGVAPQIPVLGGALANDATQGMLDRVFLERMYAAGARGHMDGISLHPYPADIDLWLFFRTITGLRHVRDAHDDSATRLWFTETGLSTTGGWFTYNDQAALLKRMYTIARGAPDVAGYYVHTLLEPSNVPTSDVGFGFGVVQKEPGLEPRPAYCTLALEWGSSFECPANVAVDPPPTDPAQPTRWDAQVLIQAGVDAARAYHSRTGTYANLTSAELAQIDSRISDAPPDYSVYPGPAADPSRLGVFVLGPDSLLICNASRADRSYCIWDQSGGSFVYGHANSAIFVAAGGIMAGRTSWW